MDEARIQALMKGIDRTLLRENLRLTPAQRWTNSSVSTALPPSFDIQARMREGTREETSAQTVTAKFEEFRALLQERK